MTPEQSLHRARLKTRAKNYGVGTAVVGGSIAMLFTLAQCAGRKAIDTVNASYAATTMVNERFAAIDQRLNRDSMVNAYWRQDMIRRMTTQDSLLHCIRATQRHRGECE
jgi:hypothetical protein